MATGIVSIAAADHVYDGISDVLAVISVALLAGLTVLAIVRLRPDFDDLDVPVQLLTFVAACAVVGTRLAWWPLGVVGLLGWLLLLPIALRVMWRNRWTGLRDRARGGWDWPASRRPDWRLSPRISVWWPWRSGCWCWASACTAR